MLMVFNNSHPPPFNVPVTFYYFLVHRFQNRCMTQEIKLCGEEFQKNKGIKAGKDDEGLKGISFILTVSDNEIGIPESFAPENPVLICNW